jgi:WD40 repeat protein
MSAFDNQTDFLNFSKSAKSNDSTECKKLIQVCWDSLAVPIIFIFSNKPALTLDYKSLVIRKLKLKSAWRKGPLPKPKIFKGHKENISLIQIKDDLVITLSWDRTIKIWNKLSTKPKYVFTKTLVQHSHNIVELSIMPINSMWLKPKSTHLFF